ncbi:MAG: hypothetical protein O2992_06825 [Gemmatimonadetes bacterium]|nr:hypothetical protein [Gemmatimonadota bacterium]
MSKRLQVVMTEEEYGEIQSTADRHRLTVSEWVRDALRDAREREVRGPSATVREAPPACGASALERVRLEMDVKEELLGAVRERFRLPTDRAAVEYALRRVAIKPMTKEEALAMEGVGWDGDLDAMRSGDPGDLW